MAIPVLAACGMPKVLQAHLLTNSIYVWQDADRQSHEARQSEGGEQGDPLMPALYAIAQHPAFAAVHTQLREGEAVFAYLDDIYVVAVPERIRELLDACQQALREHACIELNRGETRIWNAAGEEPAHISELRGHGEQPIWTGDSSLPRDRQGLLVLGTPLGTDDDVRGKEADGARPPPHPHPRGPRPASCVATSALLRRPPSQLPPAERPARTHIANCLGSLVHSGDQLPAAAVQASQLALGFGGQGLRSATRSPQIAANLLHALAAPHASGSSAVAAVAQAADHLAAQGYRVPAWAWDAPEPRHPAQADDHDQPGHRLRGWQRYAARACDQRAFETHLATLPPASRALLLSQAGPHAACCFTVRPTHEAVTIPSAEFRVLLLRRLRLALPLAPRLCACRGLLDPLGDHRAACATSGALASRAMCALPT